MKWSKKTKVNIYKDESLGSDASVRQYPENLPV
jgi:hypothetical protein